MRSNLLPINQLLMCMGKSQPGDYYPTQTPSIVKVEPYQIGSSENSRASFDDNETIAFGPIKVKPRKKPAPTLATGRRSKYEILSPEEEQKRHVRRARNRAAAERVRISRLNIEQQLLEQIGALEKQEEQLVNDVQTLQHQKLHLETRLFTHEQMCSNTSVSNDLTSYLPLDNIPTSFQQNDKLPELNFDDLFFNSLTNEQIQQNFPDSLSTIVLTDDLNFLMDSY
jgi:hypothetical protein